MLMVVEAKTCSRLYRSQLAARPYRRDTRQCNRADGPRLFADHGYRVYFNQIVRRRHLADLDHGRSRRRRLEIFAPDFVDQLEVLHVAHIDIDPAYVVHGAAGLFDGGLDVFADLPRLRLDIADTGDGPIGTARRHAGNEDEAAARGDHRGVGKMTARLAELW